MVVVDTVCVESWFADRLFFCMKNAVPGEWHRMERGRSIKEKSI